MAIDWQAQISIPRFFGFRSSFRKLRRRAEIGFLHARGFAALIGDTRRPDFLPFDRREQFDFGQRNSRQICFVESAQFRNRVFIFEQRKQLRDSGWLQIEQCGFVRYQPCSNFIRFIFDPADFHDLFFADDAGRVCDADLGSKNASAAATSIPIPSALNGIAVL
jgi:hypothetical protein